MLKKEHERAMASKLRQEGKSVKEIAKELKVATGSVSTWVRNIILTEDQKKILSHRDSKNLLKGRIKGTITKRRKEMGEEKWLLLQKERKEKAKEKYKKTYDAIWWAEKRKALKKLLVDYKGGSCCQCGYNKCIASLEFHHRDPTKKDFIIGKAKSIKLEKVIEEVDKCNLMCGNCHTELHFLINEKKREQLKLKMTIK